MELYPWVVLGHVVLIILALGAHGVSAFAMFRARSETDRARLAAVLDLSSAAVWTAGIGLLIAVLLGIIAAVMGGHFERLWPWAAIVVTVLVFVAMTPMAAGPMNGVREALGPRGKDPTAGDPPAPPATDEQLAAAQARLKPELVATIGIAGIIVLVWLMEMKPF
ncbi:MAG: hypothetical protein OEV61_07960 [Chloroflexota bacterium]|jgi:hypothetical protein|nr:hypothetical protein [Chloroflexota bacterium]MDH5244062.1 hypothetical protein [Chloroflexota bacterium]